MARRGGPLLEDIESLAVNDRSEKIRGARRKSGHRQAGRVSSEQGSASEVERAGDSSLLPLSGYSPHSSTMDMVAERSLLRAMSPLQETITDYQTMDLTAGSHLMEHYRASLNSRNIVSAAGLKKIPSGRRVVTAGAVIVRQRPGTAKGFVFLTLEDETGMSQAIVRPDLFQEHRSLIVSSPGLVVEGILQNELGQPSIRAENFGRWSISRQHPVTIFIDGRSPCERRLGLVTHFRPAIQKYDQKNAGGRFNVYGKRRRSSHRLPRSRAAIRRSRPIAFRDERSNSRSPVESGGCRLADHHRRHPAGFLETPRARSGRGPGLLRTPRRYRAKFLSKRVSRSAVRPLALLVSAVLGTAIVTGGIALILAIIRTQLRNIPALMNRMAETLESTRTLLISVGGYALFPDALRDAEDLKILVVNWLKAHAGVLGYCYRESRGFALVHVIMGVLLGTMVFLSHRRARELASADRWRSISWPRSTGSHTHSLRSCSPRSRFQP